MPGLLSNAAPWLALAAIGALHGLSPANGWCFAAARGLRSRDAMQALRALGPMAVGHAASVAAVVFAAMAWTPSLALDRAALARAAGVLLEAMACLPCRRLPCGSLGLALWSGLMATAHGAGLMLLPAMLPLCLATGPAREIAAGGSIAVAWLAVAVHMAAMLAAAGAAAFGACRAIERWSGAAARVRWAWRPALAASGALLVALAG